MNMKLYTAGIVAALVIGSSGVIAYEHELFGGPSPVSPDSSITAQPIEVPGPRLTPVEEALKDPRNFHPLTPEHIDTETLWLARVIFSETKRPDEQVLVAWVVRNRVDTRYRGRSSYQGVVLDPWQFSAFLPGSEKAAHYTSLTAYSRVPGWQLALRICGSATQTLLQKHAALLQPAFHERHGSTHLGPRLGSGRYWLPFDRGGSVPLPVLRGYLLTRQTDGQPSGMNEKGRRCRSTGALSSFCQARLTNGLRRLCYRHRDGHRHRRRRRDAPAPR
jgi:hypothetical protein